MFLVFVFLIALAGVVAVAVSRRFNRDPVRWFFLSALISPLLGDSFSLAVEPKQQPVPTRAAQKRLDCKPLSVEPISPDRITLIAVLVIAVGVVLLFALPLLLE